MTYGHITHIELTINHLSHTFFLNKKYINYACANKAYEVYIFISSKENMLAKVNAEFIYYL